MGHFLDVISVSPSQSYDSRKNQMQNFHSVRNSFYNELGVLVYTSGVTTRISLLHELQSRDPEYWSLLNMSFLGTAVVRCYTFSWVLTLYSILRRPRAWQSHEVRLLYGSNHANGESSAVPALLDSHACVLLGLLPMMRHVTDSAHRFVSVVSPTPRSKVLRQMQYQLE